MLSGKAYNYIFNGLKIIAFEKLFVELVGLIFNFIFLVHG